MRQRNIDFVVDQVINNRTRFMCARFFVLNFFFYHFLGSRFSFVLNLNVCCGNFIRSYCHIKSSECHKKSFLRWSHILEFCWPMPFFQFSIYSKNVYARPRWMGLALISKHCHQQLQYHLFDIAFILSSPNFQCSTINNFFRLQLAAVSISLHID